MQTRTRIVLLMHDKEWRREKCATGRLACLHLANSRIIPGLCFGGNPEVQELLSDPDYSPFLLYPGKEALVLDSNAEGGIAEGSGPIGMPAGKRPLVFILDATWSCSRTMARMNPELLALPRLMFRPASPSRFTIKRQPESFCLSTLEAIHELLLALEKAGIDAYPDKNRLLDSFKAMQDFQIESAARAGRPRFVPRSEWGQGGCGGKEP